MKYKLTISYDGTNYSGWQVQPNAQTVQELIQGAIKIYMREEIHVTGSGRTDAGVHALAQIAHFTTDQEINHFRFVSALNGLLPVDIRIVNVEKVPDDFHARYKAKGKIYHYHVCTGMTQSPFKRLYSVHLRTRLDLDAIREAAKLFLGTHDFTSYANESNAGAAAKNPVRTIRRLDLIEVNDGFRLEFEANGFLYKMVRNITGMLMEIGTGKRRVEEVTEVFEAKDRRVASKAAPARGLFMVKALY